MLYNLQQLVRFFILWRSKNEGFKFRVVDSESPHVVLSILGCYKTLNLYNIWGYIVNLTQIERK